MNESALELNRDALTDAVLVDRLRIGDHEALEVLYRRHGTICYRLARRVTACDVLAEDAVQEAFICLWQKPSAYQSSQGSVRSWLLGLTHHKAVDEVRRETAWQRRQQTEAALRALDPPPADPVEEAWTRVRAAQVRAELAALPERQRQALVLAYFGGCTQREIARLTGVPLGTVKTRIFAAMRQLHETLGTQADLLREGAS